jgi:hypothetical protein
MGVQQFSLTIEKFVFSFSTEDDDPRAKTRLLRNKEMLISVGGM